MKKKTVAELSQTFGHGMRKMYIYVILCVDIFNTLSDYLTAPKKRQNEGDKLKFEEANIQTYPL